MPNVQLFSRKNKCGKVAHRLGATIEKSCENSADMQKTIENVGCARERVEKDILRKHAPDLKLWDQELNSAHFSFERQDLKIIPELPSVLSRQNNYVHCANENSTYASISTKKKHPYNVT